MPPVTIRVMDCRKFGRETLVGTHSIHSLAPLLIQSERQRREAKEVKEEEANNDQMSAICESLEKICVDKRISYPD